MILRVLRRLAVQSYCLRRRPRRARPDLQARAVSQAGSVLPEFPASPYSEPLHFILKWPLSGIR